MRVIGGVRVRRPKVKLLCHLRFHKCSHCRQVEHDEARNHDAFYVSEHISHVLVQGG